VQRGHEEPEKKHTENLIPTQLLIILKNSELSGLKPDAPSKQEKENPGADVFPALATEHP